MKRWKKTPRFRYVRRVYINVRLHYFRKLGKSWMLDRKIVKSVNFYPLWTSRARSQITDRPYRLLGD